jgi:ketosteroid isomerase-like protein
MDLGAQVDRYFAHVRGRDTEGLAALFADDAVMVLPDGRAVEGIPALSQMYSHMFSGVAPTPSAQAIVLGTSSAAVEIEARLDDGIVRNTANFFHFDDDGRIARLSVYKRGNW